MTEVQNKILAYLVDNANTDNEITIKNGELAKACDVSIPTIQKFQKDAVKEGVLLFEKGSYIIADNANVDYTYLVSNTLKDKDLTLTPNEKKVLGYITKRYNDRDNGEEYGFSDLQHIADNCKVSPITVSRIVKKLVKDSLIEIIKGDYSKRQATKYKVLFNNPIINNNPSIENNANNTININIDNEILNQILSKVTQLEQQNNEIKQSLHKIHDKFSSVEQCFDMLIDYINEVRSDVDNLYYIQNIQKVKNECAVTIEEIRKVLDK